jgi:hypothetical protein
MRKCLILALTTVGAFLLLANSAFASGKTASAVHTASTTGDLYRFMPSGIDPISDKHATQQVLDYAKKNPAYGQALASQTGDSRFAASAYKADGYRSHAPKGSTNSAAGAGGQVVATADHGNSASVKVVAIINIHTMQVAYVMVRCGNLRLLHVTPIPWKPIHLGVSATINRLVRKKATVVCLSGQKVTGYVTTRVRGVIYARTRGKVKGWAKIWLRQQADLQIRTTLILQCGPAPKPAPKATPPASCTVTINNSTVTGDVTNCSTVTITVVCGNVSKTFTGPNAQDAQEQAYSWQQANCTSSPPPPCNCSPPPPPPVCPPGTTGTPPNCVTPPTAPSVTITSTTTLNDIPEGKDSGPFYITVNASAAGSLTVDPGVGGVSDCSSSTPQGSITLPFGAGNSTLCVKLYAPTDAGVNSMTITETAIVSTSGGTAKDVKSQTFGVSHPVRP